MNVFAGVHVEAGVQEGAISEALVCMRLNDFDEVELVAGLLSVVDSHAFVLGRVGAELLDATTALRAKRVHQGLFLCRRLAEELQDFLPVSLVGLLLRRLHGQETQDVIVARDFRRLLRTRVPDDLRF